MAEGSFRVSVDLRENPPMPVTAKFSEEFYERLGHRVVDELVDWFNKVDESYRSDLRELFDNRFAHLEAKLDRQLAEFRSDLVAQKADLIKWMFAFWAPTAAGVIAILFK